MSADFRGLRLNSIAISGGMTSATFALPRPDRTASNCVSGGASELTLQRPAGMGVRLHVRGGISSLVLDGRELSSMGGDVHLESDAAASSLYEVEIVGGASRIRIDRMADEAPGAGPSGESGGSTGDAAPSGEGVGG